MPLAVLAGLSIGVAVGASLSDDESTVPPAAQAAPAESEAEAAPAPAAPAAARPAEAVPPAAPAALLVVAGDGDGDSWRDTNGKEYRLGLINTPEAGECFGAEATAERQAQTAAGFSALSYATDTYGRAVSVVLTAEGVNLNVHLARRGFADDRYLERFRHENPRLAAELDAAFAAARADAAGLWSACRSDAPVQGLVAAPQPAEPAPVAPPPAAAGDCHPDYATCLPIRGDGSGSGQANDIDCGGVGGSVRLRTAGVDPYRLDADGDGIGCD